MYPTRWNIDGGAGGWKRKNERKEESKELCRLKRVRNGRAFSRAQPSQCHAATRFHATSFPTGEISLKWGWSIADCLDGSFERVRALFNARRRRIASAKQIGGRVKTEFSLNSLGRTTKPLLMTTGTRLSNVSTRFLRSWTCCAHNDAGEDTRTFDVLW